MGRLSDLPPQALALLVGIAAIGLAFVTLNPRPAPAAGQAASSRTPTAPSEAAPAETPAQNARPAPARPKAAPRFKGYLTLSPRAGSELVIRSRPGGPVVARLGRTTEFGSPQTVSVVREKRGWLGVVTTHLPNGRLGWVRRDTDAVRATRTRLSLVLDLSARRLELRKGKRVVRRMIVGVGRPGSPTPVGRFAVTDKLPGSAYSVYYGCCIIALSAHQPNLPAGWRGGDRIAIHGTNDPGSIGVASSAGCPHARDADLRVLMRRLPLGAPVVVRR